MAFKILNKVRTMTAVLWPVVVDSVGRIQVDDAGNPQLDEPIQLTPDDGTGLFWIDELQTVLVASGEQKLSKGNAIVDRPILLGSLMFKGLVSDIPNGYIQQPRSIPNIAEVMKYEEIKAKDKFLRVVYF